MTIKLIIVAIIVIQAIAGAIAQKRAADKKKREREEALRRGLPVESHDGDEEEAEESEEEKRESAGLGDIFDVFKDEGAKRPEPPPPLGTPGSARPPTQANPLPEAARPTTIRLPNGILIELPLPAPASRVPEPAQAGPVTASREQRAASDPPVRRSTIRKSSPRQQSERQKELARRAAARQASWGSRKKRITTRQSAINRPAGQKPAPSPGSGKPVVLPNATLVSVRKAFEDPGRLRTAFVISEVFNRPPSA